MSESFPPLVRQGLRLHRASVWCGVIGVALIPAPGLGCAALAVGLAAPVMAWVAVLAIALSLPRGSPLGAQLLRAMAWLAVAVVLALVAYGVRFRLPRYVGVPWSFHVPAWLAVGTSWWVLLGAWLRLAEPVPRSFGARSLRLMRQLTVAGLAGCALSALTDEPSRWSPSAASSAWAHAGSILAAAPKWLEGAVVRAGLLLGALSYAYALPRIAKPPKVTQPPSVA